MTERKPIEAPERIFYYKTLSGIYFITRLYKSDIEYIRADKYAELEGTLKAALEAVDGMIKDRDAFHDKNTDLEKKLEIAVEALEKQKESDEEQLYITTGYIVYALNQIKGES